MIQKLKRLKEQHLKDLKIELERVKSKLIELGALKIILFGSAVRGELDITSDIDLIAVIESKKSFINRLTDYYKEIQPKEIDLLIYNPKEFKRMKNENLFIQHVLKKGEIIYERKK